MAEAYRGLTIRIGADTTNLRSAMTHLKSASNALQRDFRKLSNALRIDPHNTDLANARMRTLGNAAGAAAAETARLNEALRQAGYSAGVKNASESMERLATNTHNAQLRAAHAEDAYNALNKRLETLYNTMAAQKVGATEGAEFEAELKHVKKLAHGYNELSNAEKEAFNSRLRLASQADNPLGLSAKSPSELANEYVRQFTRIRNEWHKTFAEMNSADNAVGLENVANDALLAESRVRQLAAEFTKVKEAEIRLGSGKVKDLATDFDSISAKVREAQNHIDRLDEALRINPDSISAAEMKMRAFNERTEATARQFVTLRQRIREMRAQGFEKSVEEAKKLDKSVEQVANEFSEVNTKLTLTSAKLEEAKLHLDELRRSGDTVSSEFHQAENAVFSLETQMSRLEKEAEKVGHEFKTINEAHEFRRISEEEELAKSRLAAYNRELRESVALNKANFGASIKNLGYAGLSTVTPAVMMVGMYMIQGANDIDAAYRNMRKTVQGTEEDFERLKDAAQEFASHSVVSTDQILEIQAMGGQLGIAVDELDEFSEAVANITISTTITDASLAAEQLGQMANIMTDMREGLDAGRDVYGQYADMIVRLGNNSATTEDKITQVLQRIAAAGNLFGFTTPQLAALATAVASSGQGAEAAGTAISRSFSQIETACAKGGESLDKFAAVAGMSAEDFAQAWEDDAMGAYLAFIEGLKKIDEAGGSVDQTLIDLGINSVREKQTLESLVNMTDVLNDSLIMSQDAWNGVSDEFGQAGDAAREAERKAEGFSGQLAILKNNGQILASEIAEGLVPILTIVNNIVQDLTATFSIIPGWMKSLIIGAAGLAAAFGPLSVVFGVTTTSFYNLKNTLGSTGSAWDTIAKKALRAGDTIEILSKDIQYNGQVIKRGTLIMRDAEGRLILIEEAAGKGERGIKKFSLAMKDLAKTSAPMLIATAALVAIGAAVAAFEKHKEKVEAFRKSTEGLKNASESLYRALDKDWARSLATGFNDADEGVKELIDDLGASADRIKDMSEEAATSVGQLEAYREVLMKAEDTEWAKQHKGEVEWATRGLTDALGIELDAQELINGAYEEQYDLIYQLIDAKEDLIYESAMMEVAGEYEAAVIKAQTSADQLSQELDQIEAEREAWIKAHEEAGWEVTELENGDVHAEKDGQRANWGRAKEYKEAKEANEEAQAALEAAEEARDTSRESLNNMGEVQARASEIAKYLSSNDADIFLNEDDFAKFDEAGKSIEDFSTDLANYGLTMEQIQSLPQDVLQRAAEAWMSGDILGMYEVLQEAGYQAQETEEALNHLFLTTPDGETVQVEVTDNGTIESTNEELNGLRVFEKDGIHYYVTDDGSVYDEYGVLTDLNEFSFNDKLVQVKSNTTPFWTGISQLKGTNITKGVDVTANTGKLTDSLNTYFRQNTFTVKLNANMKLGGNAAGGLIGHAAGGFNGIVRRPILTNQGLIGEAGAEAVMRWAGGTAIVPLQNRQYVRPFAQSVAQEIPMAFGAYGGVTAGEIAAALANMNLQVRMDSGELVGVLVNNSRRRAAMNV